MKKKPFFAIIFLLLLSAFFMDGCSPQTSVELPEFPLDKGTTWVYSYVAYESSVSDPTQDVKAIYQLTETVIETEIVSPYFVAHVKKDYQLVDADVGWPGGAFTDNQIETWYVVDDRRIFESSQPIDQNNISTDNLILAYDFPLFVNKTWCLTSSNPKDINQKEITGCESAGKREVTNKGNFEMPSGKFDNCYEITDYFNSGNFIQ